MIQFPNCKINLGLNIVAKRNDGFHDLETVFYPVPWHDALEIIPASKGAFRFQSSGLKIEGEEAGNLCVRAYRLLQSEYKLPAVEMHLHKVIPMGSGLGGGSSDAAFTMKMLNDLFSLGMDPVKLKKYASMLGSDCAFFLENKPVYATGTGDQFENTHVDLAGWYLAVVVPGIHVSTREAYGMVVPCSPSNQLQEVVRMPVDSWKDLLVNDFENPVIAKFPQIGEIKSLLYKAGAGYASMSGSGSAVFGLFEAPPDNAAMGGHMHWLSRL
jgi:4-diphosphocytidyl-2-C-methyl-D-erythritol kinase